MAQIQFNAALVDPQGDRTPAPAGNYLVVLKGSKVEVNKGSTGKMIACTFEVIDGELKGKTIFQNINFLHQNPVAQEIGQSKLSALCHTVGVLQIQDTQQLHGIPLRIQVSVSDDQKYNEIDAYQRADGQPLVKGAAVPAGGGQQAAPAWATQAPAPQQQAPANVVPMPQAQPPAAWQQPQAPVEPQHAPQPQQAPAATPPWQQPQAAPAPQSQPTAPQGSVPPPWVKQ